LTASGDVACFGPCWVLSNSSSRTELLDPSASGSGSNWRGFALGEVDRAAALADGAARAVGALHHFNTEAMVTCFAAELATLRQEPDAAAERAAALQAAAADHGTPFWSAMAAIIHGWATAMLGNPEAGVAEG
jgi:hypothetical protein